MKVIAYITNKTTGEQRRWDDIPREEQRELGRKLNATMLEAIGATPMKEQDTKETA